MPCLHHPTNRRNCLHYPTNRRPCFHYPTNRRTCLHYPTNRRPIVYIIQQKVRVSSHFIHFTIYKCLTFPEWNRKNFKKKKYLRQKEIFHSRWICQWKNNQKSQKKSQLTNEFFRTKYMIFFMNKIDSTLRWKCNESKTGWRVKRGCVFLVPWKEWLFPWHVFSGVHRTSHFIQSTKKYDNV